MTPSTTGKRAEQPGHRSSDGPEADSASRAAWQVEQTIETSACTGTPKLATLPRVGAATSHGTESQLLSNGIEVSCERLGNRSVSYLRFS